MNNRTESAGGKCLVLVHTARPYDWCRRDLALQVWVQDRNIIERLHAEQFLLPEQLIRIFQMRTRESLINERYAL